MVPAGEAVSIFFNPLQLERDLLETYVHERLQSLPQTELVTGCVLEIPVKFDGEDLLFCAQQAGLSVDGWIEAFCGQRLRVAFLGFTPAFAFLSGLDPMLQVPRRNTPRPRVAAGSVALGGPWAGVYPTASAGGWQLVGQTEMPLLDWSREQPVLWAAGDEVRFVCA